MFGDLEPSIKLLHFIPVILVYSLKLIITFSYSYSYVFQITYTTPGFFIIQIITIFLFYFSLTLATISYTLAVFTDPGNIRSEWHQSNEEGKEELYCRKCNRMRPERSHHCSICKRCVLKMDHHCPWIANCVGFYNQKFFVLFLFYSSLGTIISGVTLMTKLDKIDFKNQDKPNLYVQAEPFSRQDSHSIDFFPPFIIMTGVILSITIFVAVSVLLTIHLYLVFNNLTTIEKNIYNTKNKNIYAFDSKWFNFKTVFGFNVRLWFLPYFKSNKYNKGHSFERPSDLSNRLVNENIN